MPAQNKFNAIFVDLVSYCSGHLLSYRLYACLLWFLILLFLWVLFFCMCLFVCVYYVFFFPFLLWFICLFIHFLKIERVWRWGGGEDLGRASWGRTVIRTYFVNKTLCMSGYECYLACIKLWVQSSTQNICKSSTEDLEGEGSEVQDHPWLHREFEVCAILYLKIKRIYVCPPCKFYQKEWSVSNAMLMIWILKCLQSKVYLCL